MDNPLLPQKQTAPVLEGVVISDGSGRAVTRVKEAKIEDLISAQVDSNSHQQAQGQTAPRQPDRFSKSQTSKPIFDKRSMMRRASSFIPSSDAIKKYEHLVLLQNIDAKESKRSEVKIDPSKMTTELELLVQENETLYTRVKLLEEQKTKAEIQVIKFRQLASDRSKQLQAANEKIEKFKKDLDKQQQEIEGLKKRPRPSKLSISRSRSRQQSPRSATREVPKKEPLKYARLTTQALEVPKPQDTLESKASDMKEASPQAAPVSNKQIVEAQRKAARLQDEVASIKVQLQFSEQTNMQLREMIEVKESKISQLMREMGSFDQKYQASEARVQAAQKKVWDAQHQAYQAKCKVKDLEGKLDEMKIEMRKEANRQKIKLRQAKIEIEALKLKNELKSTVNYKENQGSPPMKISDPKKLLNSSVLLAGSSQMRVMQDSDIDIKVRRDGYSRSRMSRRGPSSLYKQDFSSRQSMAASTQQQFLGSKPRLDHIGQFDMQLAGSRSQTPSVLGGGAANRSLHENKPKQYSRFFPSPVKPNKNPRAYAPEATNNSVKLEGIKAKRKTTPLPFRMSTSSSKPSTALAGGAAISKRKSKEIEIALGTKDESNDDPMTTTPPLTKVVSRRGKSPHVSDHE